MATKPSPDIPSSAEPFNAQEGPSKYGSTSSVKSDTVIVEQALPEDVEAQPVRGLRRGLSARQVQMIAIAGTIGTGLFLGTGRSLAQGGPASLIICYAVVGVVVYITLLLLGEMATQYPVAGSFNAYATRFFSPSYGFALSWNYWFNDSVSVASDLVAAQLLLQYWTPWHPWVISLLFWLFLVGVNSAHVKSYGELEYWLSSLKIVTIFIFIILGICVNAGVNPTKEYIGFRNWTIDGAPFIGGFGGFARVFVTASFAYGGTESLGITAGETKNPSKNMPRVVKFVFWRILIFYIISIFIICMNVPWDYPDLSNKSTTTSPFTIVFQQAGSAAAGSFMNTVIITSVLSAGNHALYAGTRVLYGLATAEPAQAPRIFSWTTAQGVPLPALLATASISILCFGSSYIGTGQVWGWLQNIVGVSNQIAWFSIGISSWRFRKAWTSQGRKLDDLKFHMPWTKGWAPPFVAITTFCIILIQGWSSIFPTFITVDFISLYIQIPVMLVLFVTWSIVRKVLKHQEVTNLSTSTGGKVRYATDVVDVRTVDLNKDEYNVVEEEDEEDNERRERRTATANTCWMNVDAMAVDLGLAIPEKADVIMNGMDENGSSEHSVEELQRELFVVSDGQIPLGDLLSRVMQASYAELSEMAETLPNMSDVARKRTLADWAVKIKKQVVKLYAVAKWARDAETVQKCMNITAFLLDQNQQFEEVKQRLVYARESLDPARLRNHDLLTSLDVLTTGTYRRLPSIFKKTIVRPPALTDEEVAKTLLDLESAIRFRLRLSEIVPMEMSKYRIANGRVYFSVPKLFETSVSLVGVEKTDGWFFIHVEFLINIGGDMTDTQEFPRLPTGVTKRFIAVEIMSHLSKYLPVTQPLPPGVEPPPQLPAGTVDAPLIRMFNFLQIMSLSYQLEILWYQAARMQSLGWGDYLKTTMSPDRKEMTVTYWTRTAPPTMGGQAGRARQVSLYGGTVTIAIVNEDKTSASSSIHQLSPRARVMAQLHAKSKLGNLAPSDEIERLVFKLKWQPADFAFGVVIPQEETALPDGVLEIDADNLDFSALLHLILMRHARAVLATIQMKLQTDVMTMNVFSAPGAVTLIEDGASHALRVHLCEDEVVFVTIDSRTGRLNMRDTGDLAAAGRAPRFVAISDKVNEQPTKMLEALIRLRFTTITDLAEQKARYLGMQSYRRRNFLQDELHKLGEAARGTLFIQLAAFPSHYLVIVITDMEYQYALISTSVIPGSMFGNMVMEDIAWLDLSRIHGDEAVRAASTTTPNDHPLNGSSKRKRSQDRPADLHSSSRGFHLETSILRELYSYCCARVAYMNVELQFKLRGIPYDRVNLANSTPLTPELAHIQSSLARSVPSLCVQSTDILSGAPAAEAAMPNIRVIPLNWWSEKASQVVTCVKLKYVQQPLGKRAGSSVIRPSKRIIYDTTQAVVSFLSENAATCVDEFLEEWARVSKMVVIAREVAQLAKERQFEDLRLLSFDLQTVEFAYASRFTVSISSEEQLSFIGGGSFHLRFSTTRDAATDQSDDVDMADLDDMYNPHEDAEPFLRNVLRHGPELAPSLHRLVVLLRDTLPIAKVLEEIRRDSNTTRGPDWFAKSAGWYRLVYGDLRHALDFRLMTEQRVAIIDASQSQSSGDQPIAIDTQIIGFAPIPQFKTIVFDVVKDILAGSTADSTPRNITPMDIGAVCHVGLVGDLANRLHSRIASLIAPPS